jgi:predicted nucleic acid-binding protein
VESIQFCIPEIADYELRRELLRMVRDRQATMRSIRRLDELIETLQFLPISTSILRRAAGLWADARVRGRPTASAAALDADVILASTAIEVSGVVLTENRKHLSRYVIARTWQDLGNHPLDIRPYRPGTLPPRGFKLERDLPEKHLYWVSPKRDPLTHVLRTSLNPGQIDRIAAIGAVFEEVSSQSLDDMIRDVQSLPDPNSEILDWELCARIYREEVAKRPAANQAERQRLFDTLMFMAGTRSVDELLEVFPSAALLGQLERIHHQMHPQSPKN